MAKMKISGDRGSPCLRPLACLIGSLAMLLRGRYKEGPQSNPEKYLGSLSVGEIPTNRPISQSKRLS
jgi:hypothetical protein